MQIYLKQKDNDILTLATDIEAFAKEFDIYEYNDQTEEINNPILKTYEALKSNNNIEIVEYLNAIIDNSDDNKEIEICESLINRIERI